MNEKLFKSNMLGKRLLLSLFAVLATFTIVNTSIRASGFIIERSQNVRTHITPSIGCQASIEMCNVSARSDGKMQSLFTDMYAGKCTQCNPEISVTGFVAEVFLLIAPGFFVFFYSRKKLVQIHMKPASRLLFVGGFLFCAGYFLLNTVHVFFGP